MTELETIIKAIKIYDRMRPRPSQVTQTQAAEMLCLSRPTVSRLVKSGQIRLNKCGMIPVSEIDRVLSIDH